MGLVESQDCVWAPTGQIHKRVRYPQRVSGSEGASPREVEGRSAVIEVTLEHVNDMAEIGTGMLE